MLELSLVYVGRCLTTNRVYVGSTIRGKRRILSHIRDLDKGIHSNSYLQNAWNKYGSSDFAWYVVDICEPEQLLKREQWWIEFLRASDRRYGFNLLYPVTDKRQQVKSVLSECQVEKWRDPIVRNKRLTGLKELHKDPVWKNNRAKALAAKWQEPEWRAKMLKVLAKNTAKLSDRRVNEPGFKELQMRGLNRT